MRGSNIRNPRNPPKRLAVSPFAPRKNALSRSERRQSKVVVEIANRQRRRVARRPVKQAVELVLRLRVWNTADISVAVVDAATMRRLNRDYLRHDYVTDVLSFLFSRDARRKSLVGEIVVCADQAYETAAGQPWKWQDELLFYVIHGALHLIGYNDESVAQRRRMRAAEQKILRELGVRFLPGDLALHSKES